MRILLIGLLIIACNRPADDVCVPALVIKSYYTTTDYQWMVEINGYRSLVDNPAGLQPGDTVCIRYSVTGTDTVWNYQGGYFLANTIKIE